MGVQKNSFECNSLYIKILFICYHSSNFFKTLFAVQAKYSTMKNICLFLTFLKTAMLMLQGLLKYGVLKTIRDLASYSVHMTATWLWFWKTTTKPLNSSNNKFVNSCWLIETTSKSNLDPRMSHITHHRLHVKL